MKSEIIGCLLIGLLLSDNASTQSVKSRPLRVLTLGDSITAIFRYQPFLSEILKGDKVDVIFVGSEGRDEKKHEGHSGQQGDMCRHRRIAAYYP